MNKLLSNFRILTEENKQAMATKLAEKSMLDFVEQAKATGAESGTFKIIISSEDTDRHGDVILIDGWDLSFFEKNPVVLWAHDYGALPIGMATKVYKEGKNLIAEGIFAPAEANPMGQQVRRLYELGMMNATSIGAIVLEQTGNVISKAELLEFSFVPVPANPYALRLNELGEDVKEYVSKGLMTDEPKEESKPEVEKGAVSDELNGNEDIMEKYNNLDRAFEIIYAFVDVYLRGDTSATQFGALLAETAELLKNLAGDTPATKDVQPAVKAFTPELKQKATIAFLKALKRNKTVAEELGAVLTELQSGIDTLLVDKSKQILEIAGGEESEEPEEPEAEKAVTVKEGRTLSKKNRGLITDAITPMKASIAALEKLLEESDPDGSEPEESPDGDQVNKGRKDVGSEPLVAKELEEWLQNRRVLRMINNATSDALEKMNKRMKAKS